jgi:dihydroorotase
MNIKMVFDYIIKNGSMFDAEKKQFLQADIGVKDGMIVKVAPNVSGEGNVIEAEGKYVLPGLIDEHAHLNRDGTIIGANADTVDVPSGITCAVDGGTTGAAGFELFYKANIIRYETDVYAYLNVSTFGNKSLCKHEENHDPDDFREDLIRKLFKKYPQVLRGLKVRMCKATLGNYGIAPLKRGKEIANRLVEEGYHCPVIVHYDDLPQNVQLQEILDILGKGDVIAHIFQTKGETIFTEEYKVKDFVKQAQAKGVYMDSCNGRVHWSFKNIKHALADGFKPNIISSDLVRVSEYTRPGFSLLHAMRVFSAAGMRTEDILQAVTYTPAKSLGLERGLIKEGANADIAIFDIQENGQVLSDMFGNTCKGNKIFIPLLTMKDGRVSYRQIFF